MRRRGAAALAVGLAIALTWASSVSAEAPATPPPQEALQGRPQPQILGTLDPATGKFTPDTQPAASGPAITGTNDLRFDLDATHLHSVSIECLASVNYYLSPGDGGDNIFAGSDRAGPYFPTYHAGQKKFSGTLPIPFALPRDPDKLTEYVAFFTVVCRYVNSSSAPIFMGTYKVVIDEGGAVIGVGGIMDGYTSQSAGDSR